MNDIFISYRREGGSTTARLICKMLEDAGFRCFFDSESLSFGSFADSIKENLRTSRNFILIVSPGAFDRCHSADDWVRQEIALALELHRAEKTRIIPLFTNGVTGFPADLPADIRAIAEQNGVELNHKNFDSNFTSLLERIHHEKRDQLVNKFLDLQGEDPGSIAYLIETFSDCLTLKQQHDVLKSGIKAHWKGKGDIGSLVGRDHDSTLRQLCIQLGVHPEGGHEALFSRLERWLTHGQLDAPDHTMSKSILESYLRHNSWKLPFLCDELALKVDKRSPQKMRSMLAGRLELELNFHELLFQDLKVIAGEALGEDMAHGLRKQELVDILTTAYERGRQNQGTETDASR